MRVVLKINKRKFLEYWGILWFILFSGSLYFQILRIRFTMVIVGATIVLMALYGWSVTNINGKRLIIYIIVMLINSMFTITNGFDINDFILVILRMFFCIMIQSNMSDIRFKRIFIDIMCFEAALSLICFLYADILSVGSLPLMHYTQGPVNGYYLTPYYTLGWKNIPVFHRNAGWFLEPGAHQIFLNFALLFLLANGQDLNLSKSKYRVRVIHLISTVLSTMSTTGYMCLFIIMAAVMVMKSNNNIKEKQFIKNLRYLAIIGVIVLVVVENTTHVIEYKFDGMYNGHSSATTRYNDTLVGYKIALSKPIMGHGLFNTTMTDVLKSFDVVNISNGLASLLINVGVILGIAYLLLIFNGIRASFGKRAGRAFHILVFLFYLLCVNSEGGALGILIYITYMFKWRTEEEKIDISLSKIYYNTKDERFVSKNS